MANWSILSSRGSVDDRRGSPMALGGLGLVGVVLALAFNYMQTGTVDVGSALQALQQLQMQNAPLDAKQFEGADSYEVFASTVLGSTNDMWNKAFAAAGQAYTPPHFVLFRGGTQSGCGGAYSEVGPHYCPQDETIYLDETFFNELRDRFGAQGDVAQAYVIAHEVGHHVQTLLGLQSDSISQELQADCLAGLWAYSIKDKGVFEPNEIQEALSAAAAVGDDNIQKRTTGYVQRESWTHGSSAQRVAAFTRGYESGAVGACIQ